MATKCNVWCNFLLRCFISKGIFQSVILIHVWFDMIMMSGIPPTEVSQRLLTASLQGRRGKEAKMGGTFAFRVRWNVTLHVIWNHTSPHIRAALLHTDMFMRYWANTLSTFCSWTCFSSHPCSHVSRLLLHSFCNMRSRRQLYSWNPNYVHPITQKGDWFTSALESSTEYLHFIIPDMTA